MSQSTDLFARAQRVIPGGVNSPVRSFRGVGGEPIFIARGEGAYLIDVDGKRSVDYVGSWGPLILGHAHPQVVAALHQAVDNGTSFGAPTELEVRLAEKVAQLMPSIEMLRMVNSGTEATLTALRLARGFTGRNKILKFNGCYHGHCDALLVKAGSGNLTLGQPDSAGIPQSVTQDTLIAHFNDLDAVEKIFHEHGQQIAAIIVEPIAGNMNMVLPKPEFLPALRKICDHYGSLLIFDEVMTGFRVALSGAQKIYNVKPDLTTLGKVIGGGLPVGAFGGRRDIMQCLAPLGGVYQAGTLSGNPLATTAGLVTLDLISKPNFFSELERHAHLLIEGLQARAREVKVKLTAYNVGGMFGIFFNPPAALHQLDDVMRTDAEYYKRFFHAMLKEGIYFAPSAFEAGFISSVHGETEITRTLNAAEKIFNQLK